MRGRELWVSDGTSAGTQLYADMGTLVVGSSPQSLVNAAGRLCFTANGGPRGRELWTLPIQGDVNHDGSVDAADAGLLFANWTGDPLPYEQEFRDDLVGDQAHKKRSTYNHLVDSIMAET